ncbi:MAG TPA: response regulator [Thermomicrobiales bacterium]|nr:response regulator [Thermomicrobiales bacterium]
MATMDSNPDVLVAEDDPALRAACYAAAGCASGDAALARALAAPPALLLLDERRPGLVGTAVCRRLKAARHTRRVPVVFVTAAPRRAVRAALGGCPCEGFLAKPFDLADALAAAAAYCP